MTMMPAGISDQVGNAFMESGQSTYANEGCWPVMVAGHFRRHLASVQLLCHETGRPFDEIAEVYQCELRRLSAQASVLDYLPVLVCKKVRELYRRRVQAQAEGDPCAQLLAFP